MARGKYNYLSWIEKNAIMLYLRKRIMFECMPILQYPGRDRIPCGAPLQVFDPMEIRSRQMSTRKHVRRTGAL
ncbi:hypothetical protein VTG60DRAFT_6311 [Thermothelomyces hinnuleus]